MDRKLIGKKVTIKSEDSWANGEWGTIVDYDYEYYYVAIADDKNMTLQFTKKELVFKK